MWDEALKLLHSFIPCSRSCVRDLRKLNFDSAVDLMRILDPGCKRANVAPREDSATIFAGVYSSSMVSLGGRVLIVPDLGCLRLKPIVCAADNILQRIDEGVVAPVFDQRQELISGGSDVLFVFESNGDMLLFDHDEGVWWARGDSSLRGNA